MKEFLNKIVVVSGGAKGIGRKIVSDFCKEGASVIFLDNDLIESEILETELTNRNLAVKFILTDFSSNESIIRATCEIKKDYKNIDVIVNNVGIGRFGEETIEQFQNILQINLVSVFSLVKGLESLLSEKSSIINISSTRAIMSEKNTLSYSASKGAMNSLTHSLAVSLQGKTRVNAIMCGWIEVRGFQGTKSEKFKHSEMDRNQHLVKRVGAPSDVSELVKFLANDEKSGFIDGEIIKVDGGMCIKMIYEE